MKKCLFREVIKYKSKTDLFYLKVDFVMEAVVDQVTEALKSGVRAKTPPYTVQHAVIHWRGKIHVYIEIG